MTDSATTTATVTSIYRGDPDLRDEVRALMTADKRLTQAAVGRESGVSAAAINQWLNGTYAGSNEGVEAKLRIWLEAYRARIANDDRMPDAPGFIDTPTAARVVDALSYAQVAGDIAVVYGAAGLGKTSACVRYQSSRPNVWIATMKPDTSGLVPCLQEICCAVGVPETGGARTMARAIAKRIRDTRGLLIIDEAQALSVPALDEIRSFHDATGIGVALVGNHGVWARMAGGQNAVQLDRLFSRVGKRLGLKKATEADANKLIKAWGIADSKCARVLHDIARGPGALRSMCKVLRLASMYSAADKRAVCCEDVRAAARELGGGE